MSLSIRCHSLRVAAAFLGLVPLSISLSVAAQAPACPAVASHADTPADTAFREGRYADAEGLYQQALSQRPQDVNLSAALVRTLVREGKLTQAATLINSVLAANPHAAPTLTEQAELQFREGEPWIAMQTLDAAIAADPCYARAHLIRSRVMRIDSMYASERAEIQKAYDIDPSDPDIQHAWLTVDSPANDIASTAQALATTKGVDADTREKAEATMNATLPLLYETSQTCKVVPTDPSATISMQPTFADAKHVDGYNTEVEFPQGKAKMVVDTSASGLYITRALANQNGFQPAPGDPPGTVRATSLRIGPLEFHDCLVGVSETPFAGSSDGFLGTDIFASWLITLDFRQAKMFLTPLPPQTSVLPGDRAIPPELADYTPVYHRRQYLLVPLTFGNHSRKLFILATGMRVSAMTSEVAHSLSKMSINFTNTQRTIGGAKIQVFREIFDIQLADLPQIHQGNILELDPAVVDHNAGFEVAGMLGLDILQPLTLHLDYRDGLVKFEPVNGEFAPKKETLNASAAPMPASEANAGNCIAGDKTPRPLDSTLQARLTGGIDSAHLKPGKEVWVRVIDGEVYPDCTLDQDAVLYGHVVSASSSKNPDSSELSLLFDHGDCTGHGKKPISMRLLGVVGPPTESRHLHDELPVEVSGGIRQISTAVQGLVNVYDMDLDPGGPPHMIQPGIVLNVPGLKLEPEQGPGCSSKLVSTNRSVTLGAGTQLILTVMVPAQ